MSTIEVGDTVEWTAGAYFGDLATRGDVGVVRGLSTTSRPTIEAIVNVVFLRTGWKSFHYWPSEYMRRVG